MQLRSIEVHSFKSYEGQSIPLGPLSLFVGPNGSGKTSILQGIEFFGALTRATLRDELELRGWEYKDLPWQRGKTRRFGFTAVLSDSEREFSWLLEFGHRRRPGIEREQVVVNNDLVLLERIGRTMWRLDQSTDRKEEVRQTLTSSWLATLEAEDEGRFPELLGIAQWAQGIRPYVTLDPAILRAPSRRTDEGLGPRGENLAGFLRWLRDYSPTRFDRMLDRVRTRYPNLKQVFLRTSGYGWFSISVEERWGADSVRLSAPQVSDGLLRLLAISAMHELASPPSVVMVDEIDNGLHPHLVGQVVQMLENLARETKVQVVATTHNPIAVNFVSDPSNVLIAWRGRNGKSVVVPLSETKGFGRLSQYLDPGELWYNVGEADLVSDSSRR